MIVDNSTLGAFSRCHTYGAFRYWLHRQSNTEYLATALGTACHSIMQAHLNGDELVPHVLKGEQSIREFVKNSVGITEEQTNEAIAKLHAITGHIITSYPTIITSSGVVIYNPKTKQPMYRVRHVEIPFRIQISHRHTFVGRLDGIIEDEYGYWNVWELKTSRYVGSRTWQNQWQLSNQPRGYVWVAGAHTLSPVTGALIVPFGTASVACSVETPIQLRYDQVSLNNWASDFISYCDWLEAIAEECGVKFDNDGRAIAPESPQEMQEILRKTIPTGRFTSACSNNAYGQCPFFGICKANYSPGYIMNDTHNSVWKPEIQED